MLMHVIGKPNDVSIIMEVDRHDMSTDKILDRALAEFSEGYEMEWFTKNCVIIKEVKSFTIDSKKYTSMFIPNRDHCLIDEDKRIAAVLTEYCEHIEYSGRTRGEV